MPTFNLEALAAVDAPPITLADTNDSSSVGVRLTDPLLWMPAGQQIQLVANFQNFGSGNLRLVLAGTFSPVQTFAGGQLQLDDIEVSIPFSGSATPQLDTSGNRKVTASGGARWVLPSLASILGISEISFDLGFETSDVKLHRKMIHHLH